MRIRSIVTFIYELKFFFSRFKNPVILWLILIPVLQSACAVVKEPPPPSVLSSSIEPNKQKEKEIKVSDLPPLVNIKPKTAKEEKMPYVGILFSFSARNTPLFELLSLLAKEAGLNLVLEKGVDPQATITAEYNNLPFMTVLDMVLSSLNYFYKIEAGILKIKSTETKFFTFNYPLFYNSPSSSLGGDLLGGSGGSSGGSSGSSNLSGKFSIETKIDSASSIWKQIEEALSSSGQGSSKGGLLSEDGKSVINQMSGTIVVTDHRENLLLVEKFLDKLEKSSRRQVIIEAKIVEVSLNKSNQYGINWERIFKEWDTDKSQKIEIGSNLTNNGIFSAKFSFNSTISGAVIIDALTTQGDVNVLSSPRLNVINNQSAMISVGTVLPFLNYDIQKTQKTIDGRIVDTTEAVPKIDRAQDGILLGITPQINEDGVTTLHIVPVITSKLRDEILPYNTNSDSNNAPWKVPVLGIRESDTIVRVTDGSTIVIGGLIKDSVENEVNKIPVLGDFPVLGNFLFSNHKRVNTKTELVILLTPKVVER